MFNVKERVECKIKAQNILRTQWHIQSLFEQTRACIEPTKIPQSLASTSKFSKFVPPDALKMHPLTLFLLRFLCKTFSKLLKFTL